MSEKNLNLVMQTIYQLNIEFILSVCINNYCKKFQLNFIYIINNIYNK